MLWKSHSKIAGFVKESKNLLFPKVRDSGHMVPMDVPDVALDMMKLFIHDGSFDSSKPGLASELEQDDCPVCPTCKFSRDSGRLPDTTNSKETDVRLGHFVISYAWLVAGALFAAFVVFVMVRSSNITAGPTAAQLATIVPQ